MKMIAGVVNWAATGVQTTEGIRTVGVKLWAEFGDGVPSELQSVVVDVSASDDSTVSMADFFFVSGVRGVTLSAEEPVYEVVLHLVDDGICEDVETLQLHASLRSDSAALESGEVVVGHDVVVKVLDSSPCNAQDRGNSAAYDDMPMDLSWFTDVAQGVREPDGNFMKICAGWSAQTLCSAVFGAGIDQDIAEEEDLSLGGLFATWDVDYEDQSVTAYCRLVDPTQGYKSIFREGLGCTLVEGISEEELRAQNTGGPAPAPLDPQVPWPRGEADIDDDQVPREVDLECLRELADKEFADTVANPRSLVFSYKEQLVFERYADHMDKHSRQLGWSATKSLTQAMIGILVGDGLLDIHAPAPVPEWVNDERANITTDMMLRMSSGTEWVGDVIPTTGCLYSSGNDCAAYCASKPLVAEPDTLFNYNSGSSYLLSRMALEHRRDERWNDLEWPKQRLFYPIGAHSAYIEVQPNQVFMGGAWGFLTGRDWARFGLLFQRDGVWIDGNRILPEGWTDYSSAPGATTRGYGAHFWRNEGIDDKLYLASGFRNENVFIFPDQELVISRQAMPGMAAHFWWDSDAFLRQALQCFPQKKA